MEITLIIGISEIILQVEQYEIIHEVELLELQLAKIHLIHLALHEFMK
jgi:hypothetical protein